ncbi:MAG TPA: metallophosphoesterase [Myxococcota bacterium]|nr:metallophosphoesterase [Myxococcota bacterium]
MPAALNPRRTVRVTQAGGNVARLLVLTVALVLADTAAAAGTARIAIIPDTQNYDTTIDPGDDAMRVKLLDAMVDDIVAWKPDFALQLGDLTDSTGGLDQGAQGWLDDDPNSKSQPNDAEWKRIRTKLFDRLDAAGIPHLEVVGNHDSGVDFVRWFPAAEFEKRPWFYAMLTRKPAWKDPVQDTTQRAALMPTPIGTICVIGQPFTGQHGLFDTDWMVNQIGCGAGRPTILVQHGGLTAEPLAALRGAPDEKRALVIATVEGHFVCTNCVLMGQNAWPAALLPSAVKVRANWQETSFGGPGGTNHSGLSWWAKWTLDPKAGTSNLMAHNPYLNMSNAPIDAGYRNENGSIPLPFSACKLFSC